MDYIISYDLNKEGKNYDGLIEAIKTMSSKYCSPCKSTWVIKTNLFNAHSVFEHLSKEIDSNDHLIVAAITKNSYAQVDNRLIDCLEEWFDQC